MQELRTWLDQALAQAPPKTAIGKALHYLQDEWPRLIRYLDDGGIPIDNNLAENAIRPFVVGRKNWLFSHSVKGVQASANLYSLVQTAKANRLEPYQYLRQVFTELPRASKRGTDRSAATGERNDHSGSHNATAARVIAAALLPGKGAAGGDRSGRTEKNRGRPCPPSSQHSRTHGFVQ